MTAASTDTGLLIAVLRGDPEWPTSTLSPHDWRRITAAASRHSVAPLLWHLLLEKQAVSLVAEDARRRLQSAHLQAWHAAQTWRSQLLEALHALHERAIPTVLLKGSYLSFHAYPEPSLRPMGDLDLLVPDGRMRDARDALLSRGYTIRSLQEWSDWEAHRLHRHPPPLMREGCLTIELHSGLETCEPPFRLPMDEVWQSARPADPPFDKALGLSPENLLLHVATHMGRSHLLGSSLVRICDVAQWSARFGREVDWDGLMARARTGGVLQFVHAALELARRLLHAPVPREALNEVPSARDLAAVDRAAELLEENPSILTASIALTRRDRPLARRVASACRSILVPRDAGPTLHDNDSVARQDNDRERERQGFAEGVMALRGAVLGPRAARRALQTVRHVRELRAWAEQPGA